MSASGLKALFGGPLGAGDTVRYIYMDEAGTSGTNDASVVVGIIIKPDEVWRGIASRLKDLKCSHGIAGDFVMSAKEIFSGKKPFDDRAVWPLPRRLKFIESIIAIVMEEKLPVAAGYCKRGVIVTPDPKKGVHLEHVYALTNCVAVADRFLRDHMPLETATIVAEDLPANKDKLKKAFKDAKSGELARQTGLDVQVTQIVDGLHFADPEDAPLLQIADACGFALQRYFANKPMDNNFMEAMTGVSRPFESNGQAGAHLIAARTLGCSF